MHAAEGPSGGMPELDLDELAKELGPRTVERLVKAGKETLQDVMRTSVDELMAIPGIGEKTASRLLSLGGQILEERAAAQAGASDSEDGADADVAPADGEDAPLAAGSAPAEADDGAVEASAARVETAVATEEAPLESTQDAEGAAAPEDEGSHDDEDQREAGA